MNLRSISNLFKQTTKRGSTSILCALSFLLLVAVPTQIQAADAFDARLDMTVSPSSSVLAGEDLTYSITVNSESKKIKKDIIVTSLIDADFSLVSSTGTDWNCILSGQAVICTYSKNINNNASSSTLNFTITPTANGTTASITNDANITSVGNTDADTDSSNNHTSLTTTVIPVSDVSVVKTSSSSSVIAGDSFSYTLTASNAGPYDAETVVLSDTLPNGVLYNGYTASTGWTCSFSAGTLRCTTATLASATPGTITINTIAPPSDGNITNTATITSETEDLDTTNNSDSVTTSVSGLIVDLAITKTANSNPVTTASPLEYTISVQNNGSDDATGVRVTDNLDASLLFVSVDGGTDWSCSQGAIVLCDYIGNGGVLTPSATPASISLKVTTPVASGSVLNTASVTSDITDVDESDNEASVTVAVNEGTSDNGEVPMFKYLQYNLFGDMKLIGNANVNYSGTDPNKNYNDNVDMRYVDNDSDSSTFNSSFSTLDVNTSYNIIWAGLYWEGKLCSSGRSDSCQYPSNSGYTNFNDSKNHRDDILFKTPKRDNYITVTANQVYTSQRSTSNWSYSAFADVTSLIDPDERGVFGVANIALSSGYSDSQGGNYGGWAMLVIYEDDSNQLHFKNISIFNGFEFVDDVDNPTQIPISGFLTPLNGAVTGSIALFAADGDPVVGGDMEMRQGNSGTYSYLSDSKNPSDNLLNSTITEFGQEINSGVTKTYGVDADRLDVSTFLTNNQSDTNFRFGAGTSSQKDYYSLSLFAFATDLTTPIINDFLKEGVIIDANGTTSIAGPGVPIYPGNELVYTLTFTNSGDEVATEVEIFDDFDFDGLTFALDLNNFDISKTNLYSGTDTSSTPIADACGYDSADHRVFCQLDTVAINATYTMQFSVTVADPLDTSVLDENATNTAYIQYKNPNGDNYVILESNAYGDFGGKSNSLNAGVFTALPSGTLIQESVDAINVNYYYDVDRNITTKIVNSNFQLKLIYLDTLGQNVPFSNSYAFSMPVLLTLCDSGERLIEDGVAAPEFTNGYSEIIADSLNLSKAHKNDRIKAAYINWGNIDWDGSGVNCVQKSATNGNFKGVPQCLNSENKVLKVFPPELYPYIDETCLGNGLTLTGSQVSACNSSAYSGWSINNSKTIVPAKYNHVYGCLQCLTDASTEFSTCSTDNFAARPDNFIMNSTNPSYPDLLRSAVDYQVSMHAKDGSAQDTQDYTVNNAHNTLDVNQTLYLSDDTPDLADILKGTATISSSEYNITNGVSTASGTVSNEVVGIAFDDIGKVNIRIEDHNWAFADFDDTPQDCTTTVNERGETIEASAYVCGDINVTFIPDHFDVTGIQLYNHETGNFTYLSDDLNMSAPVQVTIEAKNAVNDITENFSYTSGSYENPVNVVLRVTDWNASTPVSRHPLLYLANIKDIPTEQLLGFGNSDPAGTYTINWNEGDISQRIMFNYQRDINSAVNPFEVDGTDLNITVQSTYVSTDGAPEGTATIRGDGIGANNALFVYGRGLPNLFFYDNITTNSATTPVSIVAYCDLGLVNCQNEGLSAIANGLLQDARSHEPDWWTVERHDTSTEDGNVTLTTINGGVNPSDPSAIDPTNGIDETVTVTNTGGITPHIVDIDFGAETNTWLIYNENSNVIPSPFYRVRFIGTAGGWTGHGITGHVVGDDINTKKSKRTEW